MKHYINHSELGLLLEQLTAKIEPDKVIYGIPKNGTIVAAYLSKQFTITFNPKNADVFVDDLIDSGRTQKMYVEKYKKPFLVLIDKKPNEWIVFPWENDELVNNDEEAPVVRLLEMIGEDPNRDGLIETPKRYIKAIREMTSGYKEEVNLKTFDKDGFDQMVALTDIPFFSLCEHHLLPFFGKAHIAYIPNKKIVGISKLARVVDKYAKRLQNQERLAEQISSELREKLETQDVAVILHGEHLCCSSRGVGKPNMKMITSKIGGIFRTSDEPARLEFLQLIRQ